MLDHKVSVNTFKRIEITEVIVYEHNGMKSQTTNRKNSGELTKREIKLHAPF